VKTGARIKGAFDGPAVLSDVLSNEMRVGLRRWVESTFLVPERRGKSRGVMVELHHDGTAGIAVDLAHGLGHGGGCRRTGSGAEVRTGPRLPAAARRAVAEDQGDVEVCNRLTGLNLKAKNLAGADQIARTGLWSP
jgi:hypothetical protein